MRATMPAAYRATGADPPWGDPRGYHGVGMEGYFWRVTQPATGAVVVVLTAINRDAGGGTWGLVALAAHPGGFVRFATVTRIRADRRRLGVRLEDDAGHAVLAADDERLRVDLGADASADIAFEDRVAWPPRWAFGGIGPAQALPGLSQYWHPHLLGARVRGGAQAGDAAIDLDGATAYAEKNWGAGGHPPTWWWGQAHGFDRDDACVAFAGGRAALGPLRLPAATSVVVALGGDVLRLVSPLAPLRVEVGDGGWRLRGRTARHRVEIEGHAGGTAPHVLPVPIPAERGRTEAQSAMHLAGTLHVRVRRGARTMFEGTSALAGLERGLGPLSAPPARDPTPGPSAAG
jgi:tocopherol cyclase